MSPLEPRMLLAVVAWDGDGGDGNWNTAANWSSDQLPGPQDDVVIETLNATIQLAGASASVKSLSVGAPNQFTYLLVSTGLELAALSVVYPPSSLELAAGGSITGEGDLKLFGPMYWTGGTMAGSGSTTVGALARMFVLGPASKHLDERDLRVERELDLSGGNLLVRDCTIELGGLASIENASILNDGGSCILRTGTILATLDSVTIDVPIENRGLITVLGSLRLNGGGTGTGSFEILGPELRIAGAGYQFTGTGTVMGTNLYFQGGASVIDVETQLETLHVLGGAQATFGAALSVSSAAVIEGPLSVMQLDANLTQIASLTITAGGRTRLRNDSQNVLRAAELSLAPDATLDVGKGVLIVDYLGGSPLPVIRSALAAGYNGGQWTGNGINSSAAAAGVPALAVGYAEASALFSSFPATFAGQEVDDTSVLVRFTRQGDANLDLSVNLQDFNRLAANFGGGIYWSQGNLNFDSTVNLLDFNRLASNFGQSVATPSLPGIVADHLWRGTAIEDDSS